MSVPTTRMEALDGHSQRCILYTTYFMLLVSVLLAIPSTFSLSTFSFSLPTAPCPSSIASCFRAFPSNASTMAFRLTGFSPFDGDFSFALQPTASHPFAPEATQVSASLFLFGKPQTVSNLLKSKPKFASRHYYQQRKADSGVGGGGGVGGEWGKWWATVWGIAGEEGGVEDEKGEKSGLFGEEWGVEDEGGWEEGWGGGEGGEGVGKGWEGAGEAEEENADPSVLFHPDASSHLHSTPLLPTFTPPPALSLPSNDGASGWYLLFSSSNTTLSLPSPPFTSSINLFSEPLAGGFGEYFVAMSFGPTRPGNASFLPLTWDSAFSSRISTIQRNHSTPPTAHIVMEYTGAVSRLSDAVVRILFLCFAVVGLVVWLRSHYESPEARAARKGGCVDRVVFCRCRNGRQRLLTPTDSLIDRLEAELLAAEPSPTPTPPLSTTHDPEGTVVTTWGARRKSRESDSQVPRPSAPLRTPTPSHLSMSHASAPPSPGGVWVPHQNPFSERFPQRRWILALFVALVLYLNPVFAAAELSSAISPGVHLATALLNTLGFSAMLAIFLLLLGSLQYRLAQYPLPLLFYVAKAAWGLVFCGAGFGMQVLARPFLGLDIRPSVRLQWSAVSAGVYALCWVVWVGWWVWDVRVVAQVLGKERYAESRNRQLQFRFTVFQQSAIILFLLVVNAIPMLRFFQAYHIDASDRTALEISRQLTSSPSVGELVLLSTYVFTLAYLWLPPGIPIAQHSSNPIQNPAHIIATPWVTGVGLGLFEDDTQPLPPPIETIKFLYDFSWSCYYRPSGFVGEASPGHGEMGEVPHGFVLSGHVWGRETDTTIMVFTSGEKIVVAARGTVSRANVRTDLRAGRVEVEDGMWVHRGFWDAYSEVRTELGAVVASAIASHPSKATLMCTGHSLGGALALLALYDLSTLLPPASPPPLAVTFGGPRVGDMEWARRCAERAHGRIWRIVNEGDPIPTIPKFLWLFKHVGTEVQIDPRGNVIVAPGFMEKELRGGGGWAAHRMVNYGKGVRLMGHRREEGEGEEGEEVREGEEGEEVV